MAKIGEGDSRWIVNERKDGANCNSWHWEEKDLTSVVSDGLKEAFAGFPLIENDKMNLKVKEASDVSGEVTVAQRKGKMMCYFEVKLTLKYTGSVAGVEGSCDGKIELPEIDHDSFADEFEVRVSTAETNSAATQASTWVKKDGRNVVRQVVAKYFGDLFVQYHIGKNLKTLQEGGSPASSAGSPASTTSAPKAAPKPVETKPKAATTTTTTSSGSSDKLNWKIQWRCPPEDLWTVLTDQQRVSAYTRSPAKVDPRNGGTFEFLGGTISGYYVDVEYPKKLTMQWRLSSWKSGVFSTVVLVLEEQERGVTILDFAQIGIPSGDLDRVKQGWTVNFWEPIKVVFGYAMEFK